MAKCGMVGCTEKVIGGFQHVVDAGSFEYPNATIEGGRTLWCKEHERMLDGRLYGGRYLNQKELA
jgi:hypothetical protein